MAKGEPIYITRRGALKLQQELAELLYVQRRKIVGEVQEAAAQGDRSENAEYIYGKKKLREIDRRVMFLTKRLEIASVIDPADRPNGDRDRVFFGSTVEVKDEDGKRSTYQIVGEDEIDLNLGRISYRSPLGFTLLKKREGDTVLFKRPSGERELTVVSVRYV